MREPKKWTPEELASDARHATEIFRRQRLDEPRELYSSFFQSFVPIFRWLIGRLTALRDAPEPSALLADIVKDNDLRTAFRYLAAPPISDDDLKTLADSSLTPRSLQRDSDEARRVRDLVLHILDPHRFPWVAQGRAPSSHELEQAVVASAALVSARKVETMRRNEAKSQQEQSVRAALLGAGFQEVARRDMPLPAEAPEPGEFCLESKFGATRADIVVRLGDGRVMPIECKVSNSAVNSYKRINHEAANKARSWLSAFGYRVIVPVAVLAGVFTPRNLMDAQAAGLVLFWAHRLSDLTDFILDRSRSRS